MPVRQLQAPSDVLPDDHPLWRLHGAGLAAYRLELAGARQLASSGWKDFRLVLVDGDGRAEPPLIEGIHSVGGKGIAPWFDVEYRPRLHLPASDDTVVDLRDRQLEVPLFQLLRSLVPAHGHLAVAYETPMHRRTQLELMAGVPPVATELGWSAWQAGFDGGFKDWHISEGGHEGPKKLQCDVSLGPDHARRVAAGALEGCRELARRRGAAGATTDPEGYPGFWDAVDRRIEQVMAGLARAAQGAI